MRVYLVTANDLHYDDADNHVVAAYSTEQAANRVAERFNAAVDAAERQQEASGTGRIQARYNERLREVLRAMGDERAVVCWHPSYDVEEFEIDPTTP